MYYYGNIDIKIDLKTSSLRPRKEIILKDMKDCHKYVLLADTPTPWGNFIQLITLHGQS